MELVQIWLGIILMYNMGGNPNAALYKTVSAGPFEVQEECIQNVQDIGLPMVMGANIREGYRLVDAYWVPVCKENSVPPLKSSST